MARGQLSVGPVTDDEIERAVAPGPLDEATGERLSEKLAKLLAPTVAGLGLGSLTSSRP